MQKIAKLLVAVIAASLLLTANSFAGLTTTLDLSPSGDRDPYSAGGEFTAIVSGNNNFTSYVLGNYSSGAKATINGQTGIETFCVEMTQNFSPGSTYNAAVGSTIVPGNSPLTTGVAWLYMEFATGGLASDGYNYTPGTSRELCSDELQDAIWYLQGEINGNGYTMVNGVSTGHNYTHDYTYTFSASNDQFLSLVESKFGGLAGAEQSDTATGASNYGVDILNLSTTNQYGQTVYAQDQLVYCPVPEPATFAAGLILLVPLGFRAVRTVRQIRLKKVTA